MKSQKVLWSKPPAEVGYDEFYTPKYGVQPIIEFIPRGARVWCPFDDPSVSMFSKLIAKAGFNVVSTHIDTGEDFLSYRPDFEFDCIISAPPFTNKRKFFEQAFRWGTPFALLMANTWLNDSAPVQLFCDRRGGLQLLMFDKRIRYISPDGRENDKPTFASSYFCWRMLPKDIVMRRLPKHVSDYQHDPSPITFE